MIDAMGKNTWHRRSAARGFARRAFDGFWLLALCWGVAIAGIAPAIAANSGTWSPTATGGTVTIAGITVTMSGVNSGTNPAPTTGTMNSTNYWTNPYSGGSIAGSTDLTVTLGPAAQTVTLTFSKPVNNPVLHIDRLGGFAAGFTNSSSWTLSGAAATSAVTLSRLSGNSQFSVSGSTFQRVPGQTLTATGECSPSDAGATACGSVQFVGTGITSLTFSVAMVGDPGIGDGIEFVVSLDETRVIYKKQTVAASAGTFALSGTNGAGSASLNTSTTNPATSSTYTVTSHANPITISETVPAGYRIDTTATACVDQAGAPIATTFTGSPITTGTVNIAAAAYGGGGQTITCTVVNTSRSDMSVDVSSLGAAVLNTPYTGTYTCTNAATPYYAATNATCAISGLPAGLTSSCSPTPPTTVNPAAVITCTVSGTPTVAGTTTVTGTTSATNDLNLPNNTATASFVVNGSDMSPDLSGLPATATVGVAYSGTVLCTNSATATGSALNATCAVTGLPPGVTVGTCTPAPPTTVAAGASISCPVSGTPTATGSTTVTATTGATNDTNGGTGTGGNNRTTKSISTSGSDMAVSLSGMPTTGAIGQPYSGTYTCTNASSPAIAATTASCAIAGLPAGLTSSCSPTPPTTVNPGAVITCTVSGTPTATGTSTLTGTTSASNDPNTANNTATSSLNIGTPALTIAKSSTTTAFSATGVSIPYSFLVTNSGTLTITAPITVSDNKIASVSCPALPSGGLAPGNSITCTGSYTSVQADLNAGGVTNTASAKSGTTTSPTTSLTVPATQSPALTIAKSTTATNFSATGVSVPYTFLVTNAGNVTLTTAVTVSDSKISTVTCPALPSGGLAPGASITCTGSYTTTQADINAGSVANTASAKSGATTSPTATHTLPAVQSPALAIAKSTTASTYTAVGALIPYSFVVTNSGNVTLTSAVTVTDNRVASVTCPALPSGGLAPTQAITCTGSYTITQADLNVGNVANSASAKSGTTTSPTVSHTLNATQSPALTVVKDSTTASFAATGVSIPYTFVVKNTGNVTLTSAITVTDNKIASVICPALPSGGLAPGATVTCTGSYATTQADINAGGVTNTASAKSGSTTSPTTSHTVPSVQTPALSIVKSTTATSFNATGASIPYSYKVTNSGNVTITAAITVSDNKIASVSCPALPSGGLAPAAFITCTGSYSTTQADLNSGGVTNVASATDGTSTSPTTTVTVPAVQSRSFSIVKTPTPVTYATVGQVVSYNYVVRNTGNVTATNAITVSDNKIASVSCPSLPSGGLAPNATITCTASTVITQADIDTGTIVNTASATDGTTTSPTTTATVTATQTPNLSVVKGTTTSSFSAVGVTAPYTFVVTNSGNTTLTAAITVTDTKIASVSCPALPSGGLVPGNTITCTGSYTTTQADLNAGGVTNSATAKSGPTTSPTASHTLPANQTHTLSIAKTPSPLTYNAVGQTISYAYVIRNTGNVTITSAITVSDNKIASVSCPALPSGGLAPNATLTCTASATTTQADLDAGSIANTATASDGVATSAPVTASVTAIASPALSIVKSTTATTYATLGQLVPYSFVVKNVGNITLTDPVTVSDSKISSVTCPSLPSGGLAPNASLTCSGSYSVTQADLNSGSITNTASATSGTTTTPATTHTLTGTQNRSLSIVKSSTSTSFNAPGIAVPYSYRVTNAGNVTLTSAVSVADNKIASVTCPALPSGGLIPGAYIDCTGSYTTTQADVDAGGITNIASATSGATASPTATLTVPSAKAPALAVAKASSTTVYGTVGQVIPYSFKVTNAGNTTFTSAIAVSDNKVATVTCPALPSGSLAPTAFITCSGNYTVTQADIDAGAITNTASASSGPTTSPTTTHTVNATQTTSLAFDKSTTTTAFATSGATIPYSYKVTNTGNTSLTIAVTVADNKVASVSCPALPSGGLAPGQFITCTGLYTTSQADLDAGFVTNIASAKSGAVTSPTDTVTVPATQIPKMSIVKSTTATTYALAGNVVPYTYVVTNTGNTTLTNAITVTDSKIPSVTCPALPSGGLAPTLSITCTADYTVTQDDIDGGNILNTAFAKSGPTQTPTVTYSLTGTQTPKLTITKSSPTMAITALGPVSYSYVLKNTGNVTLTQQATVTDNKIASVSCPSMPSGGLDPGLSITCSATYTVTQADIDAGSVVNTASAKSGTPTIPVVSNTVSLTIPVTQVPALSLAKSTGSTTTYSTVGAVVPYTFTVTNSGNVTITTAITVSDDKIPTVTCPAMPAGGLTPGANHVCTGSYTITQADIDGGSVVNTATTKSGSTVSSPPTVHTLPATQSPALAMTKSASPATYSTVGASISYTYVVRNAGNTTMMLPQTISVSDDKIASVSCPAIPPSGLAPNATMTCSATYSISQADLDAGAVTNIATAKNGAVTSPQATATVTATQTRAITLAKSTTATSFAAVGVAAPYTFVIRNSGNITLTGAVSVNDNRISSVSCATLPSGGLVPGATLSCTGTYTTTQADIDAGGVTNTANATVGTTTSPSTSHTLPAAQNRSLSIVKTPTPTTFGAANVAISYAYLVRNTGNVTIPSTATIAVSDNKLASVSCPAIPSGGLAPNATVTCTAAYTTTQADVDAGSITNLASATDGTAVSPQTSATVTATQAPSITVAKSTTATTYSVVGTIVPYAFKVTNNGNTTLTSAVTVTDNKIASVNCPGLPAGGLIPAAFITCTGNYTITQADIDSGSVQNTAVAKSGTLVSTPPTTHVLNGTQTPKLTIVKSSPTTTFAAAGVSITYSYAVQNTGNTTLTNAVSVTDNKISPVTCPALPSGGLAPLASITCSATYTTTQADVNAGGVTNTAQATSGSTTSPSVSVTIPSTQTPALTIAKASTTSVFTAANVVIPYTFTVSNSGNTTLTSAITVADNKIASVTCPALPSGGLVPNGSITCTGSYTTTQADVDAGAVTNTASAKSGAVTSPTTSLTINATQAPALSVVKSTTSTGFSAASVSIPYSYRVTNSGNTTLTQPVTVSDNKISTVVCPALPVGGLLPGAFLTCTATYTTSQADIDAGGVTNTASATSGTITSPTVSVTVPATKTPALTITKTPTPSTFSAANTAISYSFVVTNSGNTTLTQPITVSDNKIASVTCPALPSGGLIPTGTITCTASYTTTQADVDAGGVTNTASAKSGTVTSPTVSATATSTQTPALTIVKSTTATGFSASGAMLAYSYKVTNTGNVTITQSITVSDNKIANVSCPALPSGGLAPAAFITCTASYTTSQADVDAGSVTNIASAKSGTLTSPTSTVTVNASQTPALTIVKSTTAASFNATGVAIPYSYKVTNSGNITLTSPITVTDNKIASVSCPALPSGGLAPGAFITCAATYTTLQADIDTGSVTNIASAKSGTLTSPTATVTVPAAQAPAVTIAKSSSTTSFAAGSVTINYSYAVRNAGNTTLTSAITVTDDKIATVTCPALPAGGLLPAATLTCTGSYTTTQADVDAGGVTNTASAKSGTLTSPTVSLTIPSTKTPALSVVKSTATTAFVAANVVIPYTYVVTNAGNTTLLSPVSVTDNKIASVSCAALPAGGLIPGATITCTGSYTTTQADVDAGGVTNTASAKSGAVVSPTVSVTVNSTKSPALTIVKTSTTTAFNATGVSIPYSYLVTNSGNTTLTTAITVSDDKIASVACPALPSGGLLPAATITCTGTYLTTQADVDAGGVTNVASATSGTVTSPTTTHTISATKTPALSITKSSTVTSFVAAGVSIPYSYAVKNTGNTTITTAITVADDKIATVACPALPAGGLLPGATLTCTGSHTTTQVEVDAGSVTNIASAASGTLTSSNVSLTINAVQTQAISLVKATTATGFETTGTVIPYNYTVRNTGNVTLTSVVTIADDKIPSVACPALPAGGLAPNASIVCTGSYTITQADLNAGKVVNLATATTGTTTTPPVTLTLLASQKPNFTTTKTSLSPQAVSNGDGSFTAKFQVVLENVGNVDLTDVKATDDYAAQIPAGSSVVSAIVNTVESNSRGTINAGNSSYGAAAPNAQLFNGSGITLAVSEKVTVTFDIVFRPGPNPPGTQFSNTVTAQTVFYPGTPIEAVANRVGTAGVAFASDAPLTLIKTTPKTDVVVGELVPYSIVIRNSASFPRTDLSITDIMPPGFKYIAKSASVNGLPAEPTITGRNLGWSGISVPGSGTTVIKLILVVGSGVGGGEYTNQALAQDASGSEISNISRATVRITGDPTFDCTDIIGKVFDDKNQDGSQDDGERGLANVRLATARGQIITTDSEGRYHIACADIPELDRGTNFILKLDVRSLPTGYRVTTENPRVIRITKGKMAKINFGASIVRVARLDLTDAAFELGSTKLKAQWLNGLQPVYTALKAEKTVLRIAYRRTAAEDTRLAGERIKALELMIKEVWARDGGGYELMIESEVKFDRNAGR